VSGQRATVRAGSPAYVVDALRRRRASDDLRATLLTAGHRAFPYDPDGAARRLARQRVTADAREAAILRLAELEGRPPDEVRAQIDRNAAR
jgi:hypothetical protein